MVQYVLSVMVHFWTDWVCAYCHQFRVCYEDAYQGPMPVAIHAVHKEFVPCRDTVLVGAVKLWVGLAKFASDDEGGQN